MKTLRNVNHIKQQQLSLLVVLCSLGLLSSGCGSPFDSQVSGTVQVDGAPLTFGAVAYYPVVGGTPALAQIRDDGTYEMRTGTESGLMPGEYIVTVVANERPTVDADPNGGPPPPGKPLTPPQYRDPQKSILKYTVNRGKNDIPLMLKSKP